MLDTSSAFLMPVHVWWRLESQNLHRHQEKPKKKLWASTQGWGSIDHTGPISRSPVRSAGHRHTPSPVSSSSSSSSSSSRGGGGSNRSPVDRPPVRSAGHRSGQPVTAILLNIHVLAAPARTPLDSPDSSSSWRPWCLRKMWANYGEILHPLREKKMFWKVKNWPWN